MEIRINILEIHISISWAAAGCFWHWREAGKFWGFAEFELNSVPGKGEFW